MSRSRLAQHSGYLERLISMIQPRFYVSTDAADSATARRFQKHIAKPRAEEKHQHKITARERKRARLDPAQPTSLDKQREISASEATTRGDLVDGSEEDEGEEAGEPERARRDRLAHRERSRAAAQFSNSLVCPHRIPTSRELLSKRLPNTGRGESPGAGALARFEIFF